MRGGAFGGHVTVDAVTVYAAYGYAAITWQGDPYLFKSGAGAGTLGINACPIAPSGAAGCEFPVIQQTNAQYVGSAATVLSTGSGQTVLQLDDPNGTLTLGKNINRGLTEPPASPTACFPTQGLQSNWNSRIFVAGDTGAKSYLIQAVDAVNKTVTVNGSVVLSGSSSAWSIAQSPTGRPTSYVYNNPIASGASATIAATSVATSQDGSLGTTLHLDLAAMPPNFNFNPNTKQVNTLYLASASGAQNFKCASNMTVSGGVATVTVLGAVQFPVGVTSSAWTLNLGFSTDLPASMVTAKLANLASGDQVQFTHGLQVNDFICLFDPISALTIPGPDCYPLFPTAASGYGTVDAYGRRVTSVTKFGGTIALPFKSDLPAGTLWNQSKSVNGWAVTRCIFDNYNNLQTQIQNGFNHVVFDHVTDRGRPFNFVNNSHGFALQDFVIRNSVLLGIGAGLYCMKLPSKADGLKLSNNVYLTPWAFGSTLTVSGNVAQIGSGTGSPSVSAFLPRLIGQSLHIDSAVGQKELPILSTGGTSNYTLTLQGSPVLLGSSSWSINPETESFTSISLKASATYPAPGYLTISAGGDPYAATTGTVLNANNPAANVFGLGT